MRSDSAAQREREPNRLAAGLWQDHQAKRHSPAVSRPAPISALRVTVRVALPGPAIHPTPPTA